MTPLEAFGSPQISLLNKYAPELLGAKIVALLMEMAQLNSCRWTSETVAVVAKAIAVEFYMLRFDELVYVFRNGPRGQFTKDGKVTFGAFEHKDLAAWLRYYQGTERLEAEEIHRSKEREVFANAQNEILSLIPTSTVDKIVHKMQVRQIDESKEYDQKHKKVAPSKENLDGQYWGTFLAAKKSYSDADLQTFKDWATRGGFDKTLAEIDREIERRKPA